MDLPYALNVVSRLSRLPGESDHQTVGYAQAGLLASTAHPIATLHGGLDVRLVEVFLQLAYATRLRYEPTVFDAYRQWALARYIGAFDLHDPNSNLPSPIQLSDAGRRVTDNQRRVFSEDIGTGTAATLATEWCHQLFPQHDLHLIDIDYARDSGLIDTPGGRRTDYLLLAYNALTNSVDALGLVESKGSVNQSYAQVQLASGAGHVESTHINGQPLRGIVSSMHAGRTAVCYYATEIRPPGAPAAPIPLGMNDVVRDLLGVSWARIGDIADEPDIYERYAPSGLRERRRSSPPKSAGRKQERSIAGRAYIGTEAHIPLPGAELRFFLGADSELVTALSRGSIEDALVNKWEARGRSSVMSAPDGEPRVESAAAGGVGLVFELT